MDFVRIEKIEKRGGIFEIRPDFIVQRSRDLMVQGGAFYAIWDEKAGLWSRDEYELRRLVDEMVYAEAEKLKATGVECVPKPLSSFSNGGWKQFRAFVKNVSDNSRPLDSKVIFADTPVKRSDYVSRRLPYSMAKGVMDAYNELIGLLYDDEQRTKFEWALGAILYGDAKKIQKFLVFYGKGGTGKSTVMEIATMLLGGKVSENGYVSIFNAKELVGGNNSFSTSSFKDNPLLALQHDADLSVTKDVTVLNSIVSHENMVINEKYKAQYDSKINAMLFVGTNKPVHISDSHSGLIRRLIDVHPTGVTHKPSRYNQLMAQIEFELGAIADHCYRKYVELGKTYYNKYEPRLMMLKTDIMYNFVQAYFDVFKQQDGTTLTQAWDMYKTYCADAKIERTLMKPQFREELKGYFDLHEDRLTGDARTRNVYTGFKIDKYLEPVENDVGRSIMVLEHTESIFDKEMADQPAQYGNASENPKLYWTGEKRMINGVMKRPKPNQIVTTTLKDLDTTQLHFVKVPQNHIVIDFDLKDENGEKSRERNLEEAAKWPRTYAEFSKSGGGIHLHYVYDGDIFELARDYSDGIEIKVYTGNSSLRRRLSTCNNEPVAHLNSGLPLKEKKPVLDMKTLQTEKKLRERVLLEMMEMPTHKKTTPTISWIKKLLDDAYEAGYPYDLSDLRNSMIVLANNSHNQPQNCMKMVLQMKFRSADGAEENVPEVQPTDDRVVFFDVEVYPNLFVICWKYEGSDTIVKMINPSADKVRSLFQYKLVGFNNRRYDNHILYGAHLGLDNEGLYQLSQKIISGKGGLYTDAYRLSFADIYDFSSVKKSLKKWEIDLGLRHMEMDLPWDKPVDESQWLRVCDYCCNDVRATEEVWKNRHQDWTARKILTDLSGLTENDTNPRHAQLIIFGRERAPQSQFVYTKLAEEFPGYKFDQYAPTDKSTFHGESIGEGGYVYAEPGIYYNVAVLDVNSMHPHSIKALNIFGPYTERYIELMDARLALKRVQTHMERAAKVAEGSREQLEHFIQANRYLDEARTMMGGKLAPYLKDINVETSSPKDLKGLVEALKLVINTVYGLTAATFDSPFKDPRNIDNIVAKRGALFMVLLKKFVQELGYQVIHIKTDSIKIPNATPAIIEQIQKFGEQYGYSFDHEETYRKICLVNDAVFIAQKSNGDWSATGAQFKHPYVFKTLFSQERILFPDLCETKQVQKGGMYLDFNENDATPATPTEGMTFVGKSGSFVPVTTAVKGGRLVRLMDDGKIHNVQGAKDHLWTESEMLRLLKRPEVERMLYEDVNDAVESTGSIADIVDMTYFDNLTQDAIKNIERFGSFEDFVMA